jgi:hypothetical protein
MQFPRILLAALLALPAAACSDDGPEQPPDPEPSTLSRRDAEPAGAHCAHGGTAIRAGADLDGNGALDAAEVQTVEYVCADAPPPAPTTAIRQRPVAASETCPKGGTLVETGIDDDRDGALDDAEVDHAATVCGDAELWAGDVTDDDLKDSARRSKLDNVRVITGALTSRSTFYVNLPRVELIAGDVTITGETSTILLPALRSIGGDVSLSMPQFGIAWPALESIGRGLSVANPFGISPAMAVAAPKLTRIGGDLHMESNSAGTLDLPGLQHLGGKLWL